MTYFTIYCIERGLRGVSFAEGLRMFLGRRILWIACVMVRRGGFDDTMVLPLGTRYGGRTLRSQASSGTCAGAAGLPVDLLLE